jgi:hypothetical protein
MTKDNPVTVTLIHDKATKRMHRYQVVVPEDAFADVFCTIYIHKSKFKGQEVPPQLEATIRPI